LPTTVMICEDLLKASAEVTFRHVAVIVAIAIADAKLCRFRRRILVPTPRMDTLSDWSLRRGAPKAPHQIFFSGGASPK
jgi:hypothetical protein